ncbi:MAG: type I-MYXAN CRISPR-associated protein Cas5/Cmx5/DevS [Pirellulaceae bacterium]|nr:MAG: type I-MYXAN CRISPR-associated protein Cas5/Cmx5/DevS [Pirellulaceae bacterium]
MNTYAVETNMLALWVEVPICAFRPHESREYQDTHPFPPPSAVYGMLLSLCGVRREDKGQHQGVRMALAIESPPERAKVFRKFRRGKELGDLRPDYQDLLIGLKLWVWLATGSDQGQPPLVERIVAALDRPQHVNRFGGLSLGESSYLVDSINLREPEDRQIMHFLKPDPAGFYNLPIWVDHENNRNRRVRFNIEQTPVADGVRKCWVQVEPDATVEA